MTGKVGHEKAQFPPFLTRGQANWHSTCLPKVGNPVPAVEALKCDNPNLIRVVLTIKSRSFPN
jgi:hypothetical protein